MYTSYLLLLLLRVTCKFLFFCCYQVKDVQHLADFLSTGSLSRHSLVTCSKTSMHFPLRMYRFQNARGCKRVGTAYIHQRYEPWSHAVHPIT